MNSARIAGRKRRLGIAACLALSLVTGGWAAAQVKVMASLEQPTVHVSQATILSVEVTVPGGVVPTPRLPNVDHLAISPRGGYHVKQSPFEVTRTFSYYVISDRPGVYSIAPITVEQEGETYSANPVTLTVLERGRPIEAQEAPDYFLKASVDRETVYVNEPVVLTYQQYSRYEPTGRLNLVLDPNVFKGFWHEDVPQQQLSYRREQVGSVQYYVVDLKQVILFPIASGDITIEPVRLRSVLKKPAERQPRRRSLFDDFFFDDFLERTQGTEVEMLANPVTLHVLPLPSEGRPENFSGAVGQYHLTASVNKREVEVGEPITLTVTVQGRGNLKNLPEPALPDLEAFDRYPSPKKESISVKDGTLDGKVTFEYLLVPRTTDANQIGPVQLNYFNTALERYMTEKSDAVALNVLPSARKEEETIVLGAGPRQRQIRILGEDLRYIHTDLDAFRADSGRRLGLPLVVSLHVLPAGLLLGWFVYLRRQRRKEADPAWAGRLRAPRQARRNLRQCERLLQSNEVQLFYSAVERTLLQYFSQRFSVPLAGMTQEDRRRLFLERLQDETLIGQIESILTACDEARFAPGAAEPGRMREILEQLRQILRHG